MGTAVLAVTFMLTYMVPLFEDIFARMGGDLPWLTQIVINVSKGFGEGITSILIFILLIVVIHYFLKDKEWYKRFRYGLLLKTPLIGTMTLQTYTLRFVKSMSLLINSKVNLTGALELSEKMVRFYPISYSLEKVRKMILQGSSLNEGLAQFKIYNSRFVTLVKVGEESNQLSLIFSKLADQMEEELQHRAKMLGNTLEPLIIVFLGFFVAVILIAMYLPMFQLSTSIGF
jgi:type IV pilus assembly protein PilC